MTPKRKKVTIPDLMEKKKKEPITMMAIYGYPNAVIAKGQG